MAERKIVKASDLKKTNSKKSSSSGSKSKIDLSKIKKIIDDNPEAVNKIKEGVTDIIASKVLGKTTSKKTTKKSTRSSKKTNSNDGLSKVIDLAGTFLKK